MWSAIFKRVCQHFPFIGLSFRKLFGIANEGLGFGGSALSSLPNSRSLLQLGLRHWVMSFALVIAACENQKLEATQGTIVVSIFCCIIPI